MLINEAKILENTNFLATFYPTGMKVWMFLLNIYKFSHYNCLCVFIVLN